MLFLDSCALSLRRGRVHGLRREDRFFPSLVTEVDNNSEHRQKDRGPCLARLSIMETSGYRPAAVCRRGHVATADLQLSPDLASSSCRECGAEILRRCPEC